MSTRQYQKYAMPYKVMAEAKKVKKMMDESAARFERRNRVTFTTIFLMLSVAGLFDLAQAGIEIYVPFVGLILSFILGIYSWLTFYVWTSIKGWNMGDTVIKGVVSWVAKSEKVMKFCAKYLFPFVALVPIVNALPETFFGVLFTILIIKSEDFIYNKTKGNIDENVIVEGAQFFNLLRNVYEV